MPRNRKRPDISTPEAVEALHDSLRDALDVEGTHRTFRAHDMDEIRNRITSLWAAYCMVSDSLREALERERRGSMVPELAGSVAIGAAKEVTNVSRAVLLLVETLAGRGGQWNPAIEDGEAIAILNLLKGDA